METSTKYKVGYVLLFITVFCFGLCCGLMWDNGHYAMFPKEVKNMSIYDYAAYTSYRQEVEETWSNPAELIQEIEK